MEFKTPNFEFWNVVFTAVGAIVFWNKWGRTKLRPYGLPEIIQLLPFSERWCSLIEFMIFIALGCLVGIGVVQPTNPAQAISAGMGWTGLLSRRVT